MPSGEAHEFAKQNMYFLKIRQVSAGRAKTLPENRLYLNKLKQLAVARSTHKAHSVDLMQQSCIMEGNAAAADVSSAILILSLDTTCKATVRHRKCDGEQGVLARQRVWLHTLNTEGTRCTATSKGIAPSRVRFMQ